jgi:Zn ribbon nucleic-acid-binding protein
VKFLDSLRLNPPLADGIRRFGFRKWYERELIFSHVYLALAVVALAGMLGAIEVFSGATLILKLLDLMFVVICGAVVFVSVQGYLLSLTHAESMANQAKCSACEAYGRLEVISEDRRESNVHVRCKKCGHDWTIETS